MRWLYLSLEDFLANKCSYLSEVIVIIMAYEQFTPTVVHQAVFLKSSTNYDCDYGQSYFEIDICQFLQILSMCARMRTLQYQYLWSNFAFWKDYLLSNFNSSRAL